jgi:phenylacetate-CoA ligase
VARVGERVPFYRERLRRAGVGPADLRSLADLRRLPFTVKDDFRVTYPFGLLAVSIEDVVRIHASSGTTGKPTVVAYTRHDLDVWTEVMARALRAGSVWRRDVVHNAYGYGLFTGGLGVDHGARALGATVLPISAGMTARQVRLITDLAPDALTCTPSYAVYLGEAFAAAGVGPDEISLTVGVHGAEPWTDAMRDKIEALLGIRALDIYGLSEIIGPGVACQTLDSGSWLHVQEDHFYVEALDPGGDAPVPDGELGELTFTTFTKQALPLLRYRTGDLARLDRTPSPDGRTSVKMSRIVGRADDMLVVRGVNVYPSEIESVLLADPALAAQYLLVLDTRTAQTRLVVCGELAADGDPEPVAQRLSAALHDRLGLRCEVRVGAPGELPRTEVGKAVRLHRWESGEPPLPDLA